MSVSPDQLEFDAGGLITAVVQDHLTGEIRMVAWMNRDAVEQTLATKKATFWSRSRGRLWVKGEESGNTLHVTSVLVDCDGDTLLVQCEPQGPSCHTGRDNCFFRPLAFDGEPTAAQEDTSVRPLVEKLEEVLEQRKRSSSAKSYTRSLFDGGSSKIGEKISEEAGEVAAALENESGARVTNEAADVLYHLLVGLRFRDLRFRDVLAVLAARFGVGGHVEKASRPQSSSSA